MNNKLIKKIILEAVTWRDRMVSDNDFAEQVIKIIEQSQWISVDDRLPPKGEVVTTWGGCSLPVPAYMNDGKWWDDCDEAWTTGITHWKPLDKPPI